MKVAADVRYTKSHEWIKMEGEVAVIGLTDYAQSELGDLVFVNLPVEGDECQTGEVIADVESVKAVSDVYSPVSGIVESVNDDLLDAPELINESPYEAWMIKVGQITDHEAFMDADQYEAYVKTL